VKISSQFAGTKRRNYIEENAAAGEIKLTAKEIAELEAAIPEDQIAGARYEDSNLRIIIDRSA
jgi:aryl-alcohol dehydrogenase-like predicted oxidoreductase